MWVYAHVIRIFHDNDVCPHFWRYLGHGKRCTYRDLRGIFNKGPKIPSQNLIRILSAICNGAKGRKVIHDEEEQSGHVMAMVTPVVKSMTYRLLVTEWLPSNLTLDNHLQRKHLDSESWGIFFQVAIACYAIFLSKMSLRKLSLSDVILVDDVNPITYQVDDKEYTIRTKFSSKIIHFKFASVMRHRPLAEVIQGRDIWCIAKQMFDQTKDQKVFDCIVKKNPFDEHVDTPEWYQKNIKDLPHIINSVYQYCTKLESKAEYRKYNCSQIRFEADGRFNNDSHKLLRDVAEANNEWKNIFESLTPQQKQLVKLNEHEQEQEMTLKLKTLTIQQLENDNKMLEKRLARRKQKLSLLKTENLKLKTAAVALGAAGGTAAYKFIKGRHTKPTPPIEKMAAKEAHDLARDDEDYAAGTRTTLKTASDAYWYEYENRDTQNLQDAVRSAEKEKGEEDLGSDDLDEEEFEGEMFRSEEEEYE
jgi:hypothetical protein